MLSPALWCWSEVGRERETQLSENGNFLVAQHINENVHIQNLRHLRFRDQVLSTHFCSSGLSKRMLSSHLQWYRIHPHSHLIPSCQWVVTLKQLDCWERRFNWNHKAKGFLSLMKLGPRVIPKGLWVELGQLAVYSQPTSETFPHEWNQGKTNIRQPRKGEQSTHSSQKS